MVPRVVLPMLAVVVLLAAACTHKGTSDKVTVESKPYVAALVRDLVGHGVGDIEVSGTQARCLAPRWVNVLQPTRLEAAGIEPSALAADAGMDAKAAKVPLTDAEIGKLVDAFGDCDMDLKAAYIDHATAGATLSDDDRSCLTDALSDDLIRRITTVEVTKGAAAVDRDATLSSDLFTALSACPGAIALDGG
ncbi:hypothetical protein KSP35_15485 [Aquihabitans sp. G128]|uniref:hypothetical protein n=1 Tax=Aquihabitans sp. G128 TaxID=2849779 RepID=UPI001C235AB9|nr:hypothetical protein [Aquihabitans sp. G128]QXC59774.1 hypothetical protein KSP35_15485 [Aquihabitans sp. G128]